MDALHELRAAAIALVAGRRAELDDVIASASSTTGDDEHDPEGMTIGYERAQAQALLDRAEARLAEVDAAIERAAVGAYGRCSVCREAIAPERLAALPSVDRCVSCARGASAR